MSPDAQFALPLHLIQAVRREGGSCWRGDIAVDHLLLHLDRTAHRVDDAGELDKEAVAGGLDDATPMLGDFGIAEFTANRVRNAASVPSSSSPISRE